MIITGRDAERGTAAAAGISRNVRFIQADLSDMESVKSLVAQAGDVDILVNNAASFPAALTVHQEVTSFEKTFDTNVRGTYFLAAWPSARNGQARTRQHHQRHLDGRVKGRPRSIRLQCFQGHRGIPHRAWAAEFGVRGVRVNSVAPGPTKTEGVEAEWGETNAELGRALPLGRTAEPEEIANAVLFLPLPAQVSSPAQPCTPTAAAPPSENTTREE